VKSAIRHRKCYYFIFLNGVRDNGFDGARTDEITRGRTRGEKKWEKRENPRNRTTTDARESWQVRFRFNARKTKWFLFLFRFDRREKRNKTKTTKCYWPNLIRLRSSGRSLSSLTGFPNRLYILYNLIANGLRDNFKKNKKITLFLNGNTSNNFPISKIV